MNRTLQAGLNAVGLARDPELDHDRIGNRRSPKWPALRLEHLKRQPTCQVCGVRKNVVPHHIKPFHAHRELELDPANLISLCEGPGMQCHITFGHCSDYRLTNSDVVEDVILWRAKIAAAKAAA